MAPVTPVESDGGEEVVVGMPESVTQIGCELQPERRFFLTSENPPTDVAVTHILISDRNIFFKKKGVCRYLLDQAHRLVNGICF